MSLFAPALLIVMIGAGLAILDVALYALSPLLLARLNRTPRGHRASAILFVRSLPVLLSVIGGGLVVLPAWIANEPAGTGEASSPLLLLTALFFLLPLGTGLARGGRMLYRTGERLAAWRSRSTVRCSGEAPCDVLEVPGADLALCVGGYFKPTIYASTDVVATLEPAEFAAVLRHESAHAAVLDPLRLLWMASCPDFLQAFGLDTTWRREFARACEFAADDQASQWGPNAALDLASGLLKVARLRMFPESSAGALAGVAVSSAFASREEIEARVRVLLEEPARPAPSLSRRPWLIATVVLGLAFLGVGLVASERVHGVTEAVGYLLAPR